MRYQVYARFVRDLENSQRHNFVSFENGPMESRKQVKCSLVFPFYHQTFEIWALSIQKKIALQPLSQGKATSCLKKLMLWRDFPFLA